MYRITYLCLFSEALSRLNAVIRHPNASQPENVMAYDNAVSALGKICLFHRDSIDATQVWQAINHLSKLFRPFDMKGKICGLHYKKAHFWAAV